MFTGVIIEESLQSADVLAKCNVVNTVVEPVTEKHRTPWVNQWTLHTVEVDEAVAEEVAALLAEVIHTEPSAWYADFKSDAVHYVIYPGKVFVIDRTNAEQYEAASNYGIALGIPDYQVDFSPHIRAWDR